VVEEINIFVVLKDDVDIQNMISLCQSYNHNFIKMNANLDKKAMFEVRTFSIGHFSNPI